MIDPPEWDEAAFERDLKKAIGIFRQERMEEPLEEYLETFDEYQGHVEDLLEQTVDLARLDDELIEVLTDPNLLEAFRYLAGPPISEDDLKTLAEASLAPSRLQEDIEMARRVVETVRTGLDRRRFAWVSEEREPTEAERGAAVLASAALLATQRVRTTRSNVGKEQQEQAVEEELLAAGMTKVAERTIDTLSQAPKLGEFCRESLLGKRKADLIVGLWDRRIMPLEAKVSNSSTNSIKRLNNDAAVKAKAWIRAFGTRQMVPAAVLSGVYKINNLHDAQDDGLTIFWSHNLGALTDWIERTKMK